ncbi:MAG: DUF11 domain-containing protein [Patescibacteria group bacterium]
MSLITATPGIVNIRPVWGKSFTSGLGSGPAVCNLEITKQADPGTIAPGGTISYTITVKNTGTADCTGGGVELKEYYDPSTEFITATPAPYAGDDIWNFGTVEPGEEHGVNIEVKTSESVHDGDALVNKACVWADQQGNKDDEASWKCASVTTIVVVPLPPPPPPPTIGIDLSLTKSANPSNIQNEQETVFTVMVHNSGPEDASGVHVVDLLPDAFIHVSDTGAGAYNKDTGLWTLGTLAKDASKSLDIRVRARTSGTFENMAQVSAADQTDIDSTPNNNVPTEDDQASATVRVAELPGPPGGCTENCGGRSTYPKITLIKSVNKPTALAGEVVTYTFTVTARGDEASSNVMVTDTLPQGFTFMEGASTSRTWDFGAMAVGTSRTESYDVLIGTEVNSGFYENKAVATISNGIPDDNRSEARATVEVLPGGVPAPRLDVTKSASVAFTNPDTDIAYTVVVRNSGTQAARNVTVEDVLPTGFTFTDSGTSIRIFTVGDLAVGQSATIPYIVHVAAEVAGGIATNFATARADNAGPASATTDVEIRTIQVRGYTTLPDTGTGGINPVQMAYGAFAMLLTGITLAYRYRIFFREATRAYRGVNFISR